MAYLDHNATSPLWPKAMSAMQRELTVCGNASAIHRAGRAARAVVEGAREAVAGLVNTSPNNIVFTSGGSESNALALWGAMVAMHRRPTVAGPGHIAQLIVSTIEHDSVLNTAAAIGAQLGVECVYTPVTKDGVVDLNVLETRLSRNSGRALIAVMAANNETGVIQPIDEVAALASHTDALLMVDAAQACGKIALDFTGLNADFLTLSAHKFGGPQGVGAMVLKPGAPFAAQIPGAQEMGRRGGTENVAGIAGLGAAAECITHWDCSRTKMLRDRFEAKLKGRFSNVMIFGEAAPRLANTSNFAIPGVRADTAVLALDLEGVMMSSGAACSSGKVQQSHVLSAMGVSSGLASCGLRASFGWNSDDSDIDVTLGALERVATRIRKREAA